MFSGAQISVYPMTDGSVGVILDAISALDPYRHELRIETDDVSTLIVGPPERLFPAMRDLFVRAAESGRHCVLSAAVSRGCPGEPDPICAPDPSTFAAGSLPERIAAAREAVPTPVRPDRRSRRNSRSTRSVPATTWTRSGAASTSSAIGRVRPAEELLHQAARRRGTGLRYAFRDLPDYGALAPGLLVAMFALRCLSGAMLGGFLGHAVTEALHRTGVLSGLAIDRDKRLARA